MNMISAVTRISVRRFIACLSAGLVIAAAPTASGQESPKIGVVDFREVALGSRAGKAAKARMEKLAGQLKKDMKIEQAKLLARRKDLEATTTRLTPAERLHRTATLEEDEAAFQQLFEEKTEELRDAETLSIQGLADRIVPLLTAYADEKGLSVILEARRPGILYFDKRLDISAEIVKRFNRTSK